MFYFLTASAEIIAERNDIEIAELKTTEGKSLNH